MNTPDARWYQIRNHILFRICFNLRGVVNILDREHLPYKYFKLEWNFHCKFLQPLGIETGNMALLRFSVSVVFLVLIVGVSCDELLPFAKAAKAKIPADIFQKVYDTHFTGDDDLKTAVANAVEAFGKQVNLKIPDNVVKALQEGVLKIKDKLTPELFFELYANAADKLLRQDGILNDDNLDMLAQKYADNLIHASKYVKHRDISDTLPSVAGAIGHFLRSLGINGQKDESKIYPYFLFIVEAFTKIVKS